MEPIAHLRLVEKSEPPKYDEQTLKAHNEKSGRYAAEALRCIGLDEVRSFCGNIHDLGKATKNSSTTYSPTTRSGAVNDDHKNGFEHRLTKDGIDYDEAKKSFNEYCFSDTELKSQFNSAAEQLTEIIAGIRERNPKKACGRLKNMNFR